MYLTRQLQTHAGFVTGKLLWVSGEIAMLEELGSPAGDFPVLWPRGLGFLVPTSPE